MVETVGSMRCVSNDRNQPPEPGDIEVAGKDRLDPIDIQQSDDIEMADRRPT